MSTRAGRKASDYGTCEFCDRPSILARRRICDAHYVRERRGMPLHVPVRVVYPDRAAALYAAALKYAAAESEEAFRNAASQLISSAKRYANTAHPAAP